MQEEFQELAKEFKKFSEDMKNPVVVGGMLNQLSQERASTNLILKEINAKLDRLLVLEARIGLLEKALSASPQIQPEKQQKPFLAEVDEQIVAFVKESGRVCAEDVQLKFGYKGKNAASARLNSLFKQGLLQKQQAGKKVFFSPKS